MKIHVAGPVADVEQVRAVQVAVTAARLAGDVREVPPPVDRLVAGGRAMRRRRRLRHAVGGAALVGALLGGGAVALAPNEGSGRDPAVIERDQQPPAPPSAAPGMRLIGLGSVVVQIPEDWMGPQRECAPGAGLIFRSPDSTDVGNKEDTCPSDVPDAPWASLIMGDPTSPPVSNPTEATAWSREVNANGLSVLWTSHTQGVPEFCGPVGVDGLLCDLLFWTPAEDTYFHVFARGPEARETVLAVRDSIQVLPEGYTTVPFIQRWTEDADAAQVLEEAGLEAGLPAVDWPHSVMATDPPAGSVIAVGGTVRLIPGDG